MKIVPILKCSDLRKSISFYTKTLGFQIILPDPTSESPVANLYSGEVEIQLSSLSGDGAFGSAINIHVDNVDRVFADLVRRGLDTSVRKDSPVHRGPVDQSWGTREFYVTDPDGNTLRYCQALL